MNGIKKEKRNHAFKFSLDILAFFFFHYGWTVLEWKWELVNKQEREKTKPKLIKQNKTKHSFDNVS